MSESRRFRLIEGGKLAEDIVFRPPGVGGRPPPNDPIGETAVLSAVILDSRRLDEIDFLRPAHFYDDRSREIFRSIIALRDRGAPIDVVTISGVLRENGMLERAGGSVRLFEIADGTPAIGNVRQHAWSVFQRYQLRRVIAVCMTVAAEGLGDTGEIRQWLTEAERRLLEATEDPWLAGRGGPISGMVSAAIEKAGDRSRGKTDVILTGFRGIDSRVDALRPGTLCYVAGRPGMGKTSYALDIARNVATAGSGVLYVSPEMEAWELTSRMLAQVADVDGRRAARGRLSDEEWARLTAAGPTVSALPITIEDPPTATPSMLRALVRREQRRSQRQFGAELRLLVVDHLQKLRAERRMFPRETELEYLSGELKAMAKEFRIAVLCLSQLNRALKERTDKKPILTDLRGSGSIEQDADCVILLHRDDYYERDERKWTGLAEAIIAKARDGRTGTVELRFTARSTRFDEIAPDDPADEWWDN